MEWSVTWQVVSMCKLNIDTHVKGFMFQAQLQCFTLFFVHRFHIFLYLQTPRTHSLNFRQWGLTGKTKILLRIIFADLLIFINEQWRVNYSGTCTNTPISWTLAILKSPTDRLIRKIKMYGIHGDCHLDSELGCFILDDVEFNWNSTHPSMLAMSHIFPMCLIDGGK